MEWVGLVVAALATWILIHFVIRRKQRSFEDDFRLFRIHLVSHRRVEGRMTRSALYGCELMRQVLRLASKPPLKKSSFQEPRYPDRAAGRR